MPVQEANGLPELPVDEVRGGLETQLRAAQEGIIVDIRNAWETIAVQRKNVEAAGFSRSAAQRRLPAETKRQGAAENLEVPRDRRNLEEAYRSGVSVAD